MTAHEVASNSGAVVVLLVALPVALRRVARDGQVREGNEPQHQAGPPEPAEPPTMSASTCVTAQAAVVARLDDL